MSNQKPGNFLRKPLSRFLQSRPKGLILLVLYKGATALVLFLVAIALNFAWIRHPALSQYTLTSHRVVVTWFLRHLLQIPVHTLQFAALTASLYGLISAVEAIGLWYERSWARWLLLLSVGLSLPFEVWELVHSASGLKLVFLLANILAFWYVLRRFPKSDRERI